MVTTEKIDLQALSRYGPLKNVAQSYLVEARPVVAQAGHVPSSTSSGRGPWVIGKACDLMGYGFWSRMPASSERAPVEQ